MNCGVGNPAPSSAKIISERKLFSARTLRIGAFPRDGKSITYLSKIIPRTTRVVERAKDMPEKKTVFSRVSQK